MTSAGDGHGQQERRRDGERAGPPGAQDGRREAIVVLGAAVDSAGEPSPAMRRRTLHAAERALSHPDSVLVLTGGVGLFPPSEARVMARLARAAGVPDARMQLEERATRTSESARYCAPLLRSGGFAEVVIVTDAYHQRRARLAFRRMGFEATSSSPPEGWRPSVRERVRRSVREGFGLAWYALTVWRAR